LARSFSSSGGRRFRVLDVVPIDDEDAKYVGLLRVEVA
jgi:hypothetical protein